MSFHSVFEPMPYRIDYYENGILKSIDDRPIFPADHQEFLQRIEQMLLEIKAAIITAKEETTMASSDMQAALDELRAQVQADTDVTHSAVTLIQGLVAQLEALPSDNPEAVRELTAQLKTQTDALAQAVAAVPHVEHHGGPQQQSENPGASLPPGYPQKPVT